MSGAFISSWLRMMFSAATSAIRSMTVDQSKFASRRANGQNDGIAHAKRQALKAKRRKAHRMRCR